MTDSTARVPNPQEDLFERIHAAYVAHFYDATSMAYRRTFVFEPLCAGLDLNDKRVADLACGSGYNSLLLREMYRGIELEGYDLSSTACADYERNVGAPAHKVDLTRPLAFDQTFDAAIIMGGLHHCVADLPVTLSNIAAMLKPGGTLLIWEPSALSFLNVARRLWYRADRYFEETTEAALDPRSLIGLAAEKFTAKRVTYHGGPAYFIILNSLILRVPLRWKGTLRPPLFWLEKIWNAIPLPAAHSTFMAVWERRA